MKKIKLTTFIIILLVLILLTTTLYLNYKSKVKIQEIPINIKVADYLGFNVDTSSLNFGTVLSPSSASRYINITNNNSYQTSVELTVFGNLKKFITISNNNFILNQNDNKVVYINISIPANMQFGDYTSILKIKYTKYEK